MDVWNEYLDLWIIKSLGINDPQILISMRIFRMFRMFFSTLKTRNSAIKQVQITDLVHDYPRNGKSPLSRSVAGLSKRGYIC